MSNKKQTTIDEDISTFPEDVQIIIEKVRQTIRRALPEAKEKIAYDIPTFEVNGINLVSFAGWKRYISLYPIPAGDKSFQEKIQQYKKAKSTLQFLVDKPIPYYLIRYTATFLKKEKINMDTNNDK